MMDGLVINGSLAGVVAATHPARFRRFERAPAS